MTLLSVLTDKINAMLPVSVGTHASLQPMDAANDRTPMLNANGKRQRAEEDYRSPSKHRKAIYSLADQDLGYRSHSASMSNDEHSSDLEHDSTLEAAHNSDSDEDETEGEAIGPDSDEDMADEIVDSEPESLLEDGHPDDEDDASDADTDEEHSTADISMSSISNLSNVIDNLELEATKTPGRRIGVLPSAQDMASVLTTRRMEGWDEAHLSLLTLIFTRGQQAIMPSCFQRALNYMPGNLFTRGEHIAILESRTTPLYHSERHLTKLLDLGGYMRTGGASMPEKQVSRYLGPYLRWAAKDAGPRAAGVPPVVELFLSNKTADMANLETTVAHSMQRLAVRHAELLSGRFTIDGHSVGPPTLYSIVSIGLKIVLLAYNAELGPGLHTVANFTFDDSEHDVWNSIALALIVCHARDVQLSIGEAVGGCRAEPTVEPGYDPDA